MGRTTLAALSITLATACGTTVPVTGSAQGRAPGGEDGLGAPAQPGSVTPPVGGVGQPGASPGAGGSTGGAVPGAGPSSPGAAVTAPPAAGGSVARGPLSVGFVVQANTAELAKSVGADNLQNGDERATVEALVADVNARGGINGRRVIPVFYAFDGASQTDYSAVQQAACARFTEDNRVFAVVQGWHAFADHQLESCLQQRGVVALNSAGILTGGERTLAQLPNVVAPPGLALGRQARSYVEAVAAQGFFGSGSKVGVIALDAPEYKAAVTGELLPSLRAAGVSGADVVYYPPLRGSADVSAQSAAMSSAVLRFNSGRVDRVLFLQQGINGPYMFMQAAESQGYRPRYALSSTDAPTALAPLASPNQLRGTVGLGWVPVIDVPAAQEKVSAPSRRRCLDLVRGKTGETFANRTVEYVALSFCDGLWFLEHAGRRSPVLDRAGFANAVGAMGSTYASPLVLRASFSPTRRDGASVGRHLRYVDSCTCFTYTGPSRGLSQGER